MRVRFLALWTVAVLATAAAFVVHLAIRFETVRLGYDVGAARRQQRALVESRRVLSLEAATLRHAERVETVARGALGMELPDDPRVVNVDEAPPTRQRGAGR